MKTTASLLALSALLACSDVPAPTTLPTPLVTVAPVPSTEIAPPEDEHPDAEATKRIVTVAKDQSIFVGEKPHTESELTALGERLAKDDPQTRIYIQADRSVPWGRIIQVLDLLKQGGVAKYALLRPDGGREPRALELDLPKAGDIGLPHVEATGQGGFPPITLFLGIAVLADGSLEIDGRKVPDDELAPVTRRAVASDPDVRALVLADRRATYGRVVEIYASLLEAGARKVAFGVDAGAAP